MNARAHPTETDRESAPTLDVLVRDATKLFASWWLGDCGPCFLRVENARGEEEALVPLREARGWKFLTVREPGTIYAVSLVRAGGGMVPLVSPEFVQMPAPRGGREDGAKGGDEDVVLAFCPDAHE